MKGWIPWTVSFGLTAAAAACAVLMVVPSPTERIWKLSLALDEKSFLVIIAALMGGVLAGALLRSGRWIPAAVSMALAAFALGVAVLPPVQAIGLARQRGVSLSVIRYLTSTIDWKPARPHQTLVYATLDGKALSLDVYRPPAGTPGPVPAVIVVHGGGWSSGDKGEAPRQSERLAAQGYAVFDIQYRLAPQVGWRTAAGDIKCAIGWVKERARDAGVQVDPARITLLGRSAGGHLALLAAYTADDPTLPPSCPATDTQVESVISYYAPTDMVWGYEHPSRPDLYDSSQRLRWFLGGPPSAVPEAYEACTIGNHVTPRVPRTLLIHGGRDQLVSPAHVHFLAPRLKAAGVPHDLVLVPYGAHCFDYVLGGLGNQIVESAVLRFLGAGRRV
jgi:acetyl esterase/lipase